MINSLRSMLLGGSFISVAIMPPDYSSIIDSCTKLLVTKTPNGPAIFVADSPLISPTSVDVLIQAFNLPKNRNYLNQPVRLLKQSDGFEMNIDVKSSQLVISATDETSVPPSIREVKNSIASLNRYGLVSIMNNLTFGTLLFVDLGTDNV